MEHPPSITLSQRVCSEDERLDVATELLASSKEPDGELDDDAWLAEVRRRAERVQRGESESVSWDEAKRQVLGRLRAR